MTATGATARERTIGPVTVSDFVRYAGASGDFNPMHFDVARAEEAGFEAPFAQGMFSAGVLASFAADWLGPENLRAIRVRFMEIVRLGDTLTCSGRVTSVGERGGERIAEVELAGRRQTGAVAVRGSATFRLP
jgi:acyl dehydratase